MISNHPELTKALNYLAGRCNYASSVDGAGFNKYDAGFGHDLAEKSEKYNLSIKQHLAALKMLTKYKAQLTEASITLPAVDEIETFIAERTEKQQLEAITAIEKAPVGFVNLAGDSIKIKFNYDPVLIEKIKAVGVEPGEYSIARWNRDEKYWELPAEYLQVLRDTLPADFEYNEAASSTLKALEEAQAAQREEEERDRKLREWETQQLLSLAQLDLPLPTGRTLYKHQKEGVEAIFKLKNLIVADSMGVGKTIQSLVAAKAYKQFHNCPVFVIAPASLNCQPPRIPRPCNHGRG